MFAPQRGAVILWRSTCWFASARVQVRAVTLSGRAPGPVVTVAEKTGKGRPAQARGSGEGRAWSRRRGSALAGRRGDRGKGGNQSGMNHGSTPDERVPSPPPNMRRNP